jgi:Family of unknown function (DUF6188)
MYKIDASIDFSSLLGIELTQICIAYQVILRFTDNFTIEIICSFKLSQNEHTLFIGNGEDPTTSKNLVCLLDESIKSIEVVGEHELLIYFSNQYCLTLSDSSEYYESFVITGKEFQLIC